MFKNKSRSGLFLLFFALFGFAFLSIGGEFLHSQIHHHDDQDSHDQCALYVFQVQLFIALLAGTIALSARTRQHFTVTYKPLFSKPCFALLGLRGPPVSL